MTATTTAPIDPRGHIPWLPWRRDHAAWVHEFDGLRIEVDDVGVQVIRYHREGQVTLALSVSVSDLGRAIRSTMPQDLDADDQTIRAEEYIIRTWRSVLRGVAGV